MVVAIVLAMLAIRNPRVGTIVKPSGLRGDSNGNGNGNCNGNGSGNDDGNGNHRKKRASA